MKKRLIRGIAAAAGAAVLLSGCQKTPDAPLVAQKKAASQAKTIEESDDMSITGQVQAPERYQADLEQPKNIMKVHADAEIVIPEGKGFKLKKVEGRTFTQEDVDKQMDILMKNTELTRRLYKEDDPAQGMTKQEAEDQIAYIKAMMAVRDNMEEAEKSDLQGIVKQMEEIVKVAPEAAETEKVEPVLKKAEGGEGEDLFGEGEVDGVKYNYYATNYWQKDYKYVSTGLNRVSDNNQNYYDAYNANDKEAQALEEKFSREELEQQAEKLLADLGMESFELAGREPLATMTDIFLDKIKGNERRKGYGLYFTEMVDGLPITYTKELGGGMDDAAIKRTENPDSGEEEEKGTTAMEETIDYDALYAAPWAYERLDLTYDEQGLCNFTWENPSIISDLSDEYVFLKPFSEIQAVFEEMIFTKNAEMTEENFEYIKLDIYEVRLGYMRVLEKGEDGIGTLIPVWDFFGTQEYLYKIPPEERAELERSGDLQEGVDPGLSIDDRQYVSMMTINATDGSVIDRSLGY